MKIKFLCLIFLFFTWDLEGSMHPEQGIMGFYERNFDQPEPFEKVYVNKNALIFMPDGIYLKHLHPQILEKVYSYSEDYKGTYILRIRTQCPDCGKIYKGRTVPDGWSCLHD